ncbi:hypothetical protein Fmac_024802 [Flemingia macrophylla]|uniref:Uncharacterized protein n=1 Tax=Flemingia macrophylla TaxID=520843 RepID=A0ABD1LQG0_9FABA
MGVVEAMLLGFFTQNIGQKKSEANKYTEEELMLMKTQNIGYILQKLQNERKDCAKIMVNLHSEALESKLRAVYKKFSSLDHGVVALLTPAKNLSAPLS